MEKIIHYTSNWNWIRIEEEGMLHPKSRPNLWNQDLPDKVKFVTNFPFYLVGIPPDSEKEWILSGLLKHLISQTTGKVIVEVPIINLEGAFVREHAHLSPRRFSKLYNEQWLFEYFCLCFGQTDNKRVKDALHAYMNSSIPLHEYHGKYIVPEVWTPQDTPLKNIKILSPH